MTGVYNWWGGMSSRIRQPCSFGELIIRVAGGHIAGLW
jgi:hypothetical protein